MMENEIKTTTEALDEALQVSEETFDVTPEEDVEVYTPDEETTVQEGEEATLTSEPDQLEIHLASGTSLSMGYENMDWEKVWMDNGPTMSNNILAIMAKARDMRTAPIGDGRNDIADELIEMVKNAFEEMGVPKLDYTQFIFETKTEEALLYMEDYIRLISELLHVAQIEVITKPTDGMTVDQLITQFSQQVDKMTNHNEE